MAGTILLLILGTQILDWPWLVGLFGVSFLLGVYWTAKRFPSPYRIAQAVDHNLELHDSLSTALFYNRLASGHDVSEEMRIAQLAEAERLSEQVDVGRAVPMSAPRSLYIMAALGVVASSLFALRYGLSHRLDLRAPLPQIVFDAFRPPVQEQAKLKKREDQQRFKDLLKQFGMSFDNEADRNAKGEEADPASTLETLEQTGVSTKADGKAGDGAPKPLDIKVEQAKQGDPAEGAGEGASEEGAGDRIENTREGSQQGGEQNPQDAGQKASNGANESNSLLDKFRDAMANLLSRLKTQQKPGESQSQQAANSQGRQDSGRPKQDQSQKGSPGAGQQQAEGLPDSTSEGGEEDAEGAQKASSGSGKRGGQDSDQQSAKEGRSGVGKEDGNKDLREAQQLAAMGKISEIIGKRSQNLTGEVMVEVASGKQQLRTAYSRQAATQSESGGEIHRDEVPLAYEGYVQHYFEEVRKADPPKK
jgi:hypothetical protein